MNRPTLLWLGSTVALIGALAIATAWTDAQRVEAALSQAHTSWRGPITILPAVVVRASRAEAERCAIPSAAVADTEPHACSAPIDEAATAAHGAEDLLDQADLGPVVLSAVEVRARRPRSTLTRATVMEPLERGNTHWIESTGLEVDMPFYSFAGTLR